MGNVESNRRNIQGGTVYAKTISFTNNIERQAGRGTNSEGRISNTQVVNVDIDFDDIYEPEKYANAEGYTPPPELPWYEKVGAALVSGFTAVAEGIVDIYTSAACTVAVLTTSIISGALDIVEGVVDGVAWAGTWILEGIAFIPGCECCRDAACAVREFISVPLVDKANEWFYENTEVGQYINGKSLFAYDSGVMQGARKMSKYVGEIALSAVTGGGFAMAIGAAEAAGAMAQKMYSNREDGDYSFHWQDELAIGASAVAGAFKGKANAALGKSYGKLFSSIAENGMPALAQIGKDVLNTQFLKTAFVNNFTGAKGVVNWINTSFEIAPDIAGYITGTREFNFKNVAGTVFTGGKYVVHTMLLNEFESYVKNPHSYQKLTESLAQQEIERMLSDNGHLDDYSGSLKGISAYTKDQQLVLFQQLKQMPGSDKMIAEMFIDLSNSDADKLMRNLTQSDKEDVIRIITKDLLSSGKEINYEDITKYGDNFQKYIYLGLDPENQERITSTIAKDFSDGKIKLSDIRTLFDPKDSNTADALNDIWNNLGPDAKKIYGGNKLNFINAIHEAEKFYNNGGKEIISGVKTVSKNSGKIETMWGAVIGDAPDLGDAGTWVNTGSSALESFFKFSL